MAINKSRTSSNIIDSSALLDGEKKLFDSLVGTLDSFRKELLTGLFEAPDAKMPEQELASEQKVEPVEVKNEESKTEFTKVKFKSAVPKFVGPELEVYGPFEENSETELPLSIAEVLVSKGRAEIAKNS